MLTFTHMNTHSCCVHVCSAALQFLRHSIIYLVHIIIHKYYNKCTYLADGVLVVLVATQHEIQEKHTHTPDVTPRAVHIHILVTRCDHRGSPHELLSVSEKLIIIATSISYIV